MAGYPDRPTHFAHKFTRLLAKSCAAQDIGPDGFTMAVVVAHTEDARRYTGPVTFYNEQLSPICGAGSVDAMARTRDKLIRFGWLHYEHGGRSRPGKYWVLIPEHCLEFTDAPVDHDENELLPQKCGTDGNPLPQKCGANREVSAELTAREPRSKCGANREVSADLSYLSLNPSPEPMGEVSPKPPRARFEKPTLEKVQAYCRERGNSVDPQRFFDYYESNGWKVGKNPMKSWQAAIRSTWEKDAKPNGKPKQTVPHCLTREECAEMNRLGRDGFFAAHPELAGNLDD